MSEAAKSAEKVALWAAPDMGAPAANRTLATVGGLVDLQEEAHKEAFAQGLAEGRAAGQAEIRVQVERLEAMLHELTQPFEVLDEEVERELLTLAMALARQIVRRELKADPTQIIGIIREAIGALPVAAREIRVQLHPEDAAIVRLHSGADGKRTRLDHRRRSHDGSGRLPHQHAHFTDRCPARDAARHYRERIARQRTQHRRSPRRQPMTLAGAVQPRSKRWAQALANARERMAGASDIVVEGTLNRMVGMTLEAVGCEAAVGGRCLVDTAEGKQIEAEVVGFSGEKLFLMPTGDIRGVMPGARVIPTRGESSIVLGDGLLGRVLDRRRSSARWFRGPALHRPRAAYR